MSKYVFPKFKAPEPAAKKRKRQTKKQKEEEVS